MDKIKNLLTEVLLPLLALAALLAFTYFIGNFFRFFPLILPIPFIFLPIIIVSLKYVYKNNSDFLHKWIYVGAWKWVGIGGVILAFMTLDMVEIYIAQKLVPDFKTTQVVTETEDDNGNDGEELTDEALYPNHGLEQTADYLRALYLFIISLCAYATFKLTTIPKKDQHHNSTSEIPIKIVIGIVLIGCLAPMPYWYYNIVRILCCFLFFKLAINEEKRNNILLVLFYGFCAFLLNPIVEVTFTKPIWNVIDVSLALILMMTAYFGKMNVDYTE